MKSTLWTAGLEPVKKAEIQKRVEQNVVLLTRLSEILKHKCADDVRNQKSVKQYSDPNWALKQADHIGYQRALSEILNLTRF